MCLSLSLSQLRSTVRAARRCSVEWVPLLNSSKPLSPIKCGSPGWLSPTSQWAVKIHSPLALLKGDKPLIRMQLHGVEICEACGTEHCIAAV